MGACAGGCACNCGCDTAGGNAGLGAGAGSSASSRPGMGMPHISHSDRLMWFSNVHPAHDQVCAAGSGAADDDNDEGGKYDEGSDAG